MDATELRDFIRTTFTRTAFRLETLQQYDPAAPDYRRYLDGEAGPNKQAWLDRLRDERDRGLYRHRVRIVTRPVTDYTRYECEWGYAPNVGAGEDVRILDLGEQSLPIGEHDPMNGDWWLIDDEHLIVMRYDRDGAFASGRLVGDAALVDAARAARKRLWRHAQPFTDWWNRNPELRRDQRRAA